MAKNLATVQLQEEEVWPSLVSIIVPLVQLISVVVVGLSDTFRISQFLYFPDMLNLVNLFTMLVTISGIAWFWYWRNNLTWIGWDSKKVLDRVWDQVRVERLIRKLIISLPLLMAGFIMTTVFLHEQAFLDWSLALGIIQYISYSALLVVSGIAIYIWLFEYVKKKQSFEREDFVRNLIAALGEYNLIERPNIKIFQNNAQGAIRRVEIEINSKYFVLETSLDGIEIMSAQTKEEFESKDSLTIGDLQAQVQALLEQIDALQGGHDPSKPQAL